MLPRAALRAVRIQPSSLSTRQSLLVPASYGRSYASGKRPPPPPLSPRPKAPLNRDSKVRVTPPNERTSPGTSVPSDQIGNPRDGTLRSAAAGGAAAQSPVIGNRPSDSTAKHPQPVNVNSEPREPISEEPVPGTVRDAKQQAQAVAENIESPGQSQQAEEPQKPLPDLRQGIPSTFEFEFAQGKKTEGTVEGDEGHIGAASGDEGEQSRTRGRDEREYDRSAYETSLDRRRAQMANYLYASVLIAALGGTFYFARPFGDSEDVPVGLQPEDAGGWSPTKMYARVRARWGSQLGYYTEPTFPKLLPETPLTERPPYTLVLSLEDLLIHSSWDRKNGYRTAKRPGLDYFIRYLSPYYELVLFTSAPRMMADPIMAKMDPYHIIMWILGREATKYEGGEYIKDLSYLNRPLDKTIIIDTHAGHVKNQPENAILLPKWSGDAKDGNAKDLVALIPFLEYIATMSIEDVRKVLKSFDGKAIPEEFARREAIARKEFMAQYEKSQSKKPRMSLGSLAGGLGIKNTPGMGGGMVFADGSTVADGLAQGKMLSDQIREQGHKQYEELEKRIQENGAEWLRQEEEAQKKMIEEQMKDMKKGWFGSWGK